MCARSDRAQPAGVTFKVKINEKMHAEIVEQLEAKLAAGEISDEEAKTVETVEAINEKAKLTE